MTSLDAVTKPDRDFYMDLLRGLSILVVVLGHWLMAEATWNGSELIIGNALAEFPALGALTWILQVIPVFFFVGGFANYGSWGRASGEPAAYAAWVLKRVRRILKPTAAYLAVVLVLLTVLDALGVIPSLAEATILATQLFWFLGIYLVVVAFTPAMAAWHRRSGALALVVLAAIAMAADVLRFGFDLKTVAFINFGAVWLFAHQLGFFYAERRIRRNESWTMVAGGLAALAALVAFGPYPLSMVGLPGEVSNMNPPTAALIALSVWQVGLAVLLADKVRPWLNRRRPQVAVYVVNRSIMTILLWHLPVAVLVARLLVPLGLPEPDVGSLGWWLAKLAWVAVFGVALAGVVLVFRRFEDVAPPRREPSKLAGTGPMAVIGVTLVSLGLLAFTVGGPDGLLETSEVELIIFAVSPLLNVVYLGLGALLLRASVVDRNTASAAAVGVGLALLALAAIDLTANVDALATSPPNGLLHAVLALSCFGAAWAVRRVLVAV